ncbi:PEP-CTERM sorting domain-containing protein [Colwellia sp. 1_MG-2023]|uniref:PEP-CTERM sorting domain-containing protein n=1 Tax=Colwellia sp. 1_MG-2023 TaxID=3062649 RepID=UPI0026E4433C|nr:PEP-CTERM sorting domain-containing protein [Colwellia sp. 1_MG-2023]MDO6444824.1 PEP-CTERM sorting domain-containing protein [Colwellia sp. 1_MG-2023]
MRILYKLLLLIILTTSNLVHGSKILFAYDTNGYQNQAALFHNILSVEHDVTFFNLFTDTASNLSDYEQIFVFDLSSRSDDSPNHLFNYQMIANWYQQQQYKNIIADGRILSSLLTTTSNEYLGFRNDQEHTMLVNYAEQMALRGGGLFLGTDHCVPTTFCLGINTLNSLIGIDSFTGHFMGQPIAIVDDASPLYVESATFKSARFQAPAIDDPSHTIIATSTGSATPLGLQSNGLFFNSFAVNPTDYSNYGTPHNTLISYSFSEPLTGTVEVPEPSTIWLFIFSLLMWFITRRHRTTPELLSRMLKQRVTT